MPKKYSETAKSKWLELYEGGKTERWIARQHAKCDIRTVRRGIEEARLKKDTRLARMELVKEALRKHQDSLLGELDDILSGLQLPAYDFVVLSWHRNGNSIFTEPDAGETEAWLEKAAEWTFSAESKPEWELLRQHLRGDKLWKIIAQWKKVLSNQLRARIALQRKAVTILERRTGYKLTDRNAVPPPRLWSYTTGDLFLKLTLGRAFGVRDSTDLKSEVVADTSTGQVRYRNSILAEAPGNEKKCRRNLLAAFNELQLSPELVGVVDTYEQLKAATTRARRVVEETRLLGLIHGQCKICSRLGV